MLLRPYLSRPHFANFLSDLLGPCARAAPLGAIRPRLQAAPTVKTPSVRHVTSWVQTPRQSLPLAQVQFVSPLCEVSTDVAGGRGRALAFRPLRKERTVAAFPGWLEKAEQCPVVELRNFAVGIPQEYAAGAAALQRITFA